MASDTRFSETRGDVEERDDDEEEDDDDDEDDDAADASPTGDGAAPPRRKKKKKIARGLRKGLARATGQRHVIGRLKRWLFGASEPVVEEPAEAPRADEPPPHPSIAPLPDAEDEDDGRQLLAPEARRIALASALPARLRERRLRRRFAARIDGYDLDRMSRQLADLADKPVVIVIRTRGGRTTGRKRTPDEAATAPPLLLGLFLGSAPFGDLARVSTESKATSLDAAVVRLHHTDDDDDDQDDDHQEEDDSAAAARVEPRSRGRGDTAAHDVFTCESRLLFDRPGAYIVAARTKSFLALGANAATGGAALRLSSNMDSATSEASDLFGSPPLHTAHKTTAAPAKHRETKDASETRRPPPPTGDDEPPEPPDDAPGASREPPPRREDTTARSSHGDDTFGVIDVEVYALELPL